MFCSEICRFLRQKKRGTRKSCHWTSLPDAAMPCEPPSSVVVYTCCPKTCLCSSVLKSFENLRTFWNFKIYWIHLIWTRKSTILLSKSIVFSTQSTPRSCPGAPRLWCAMLELASRPCSKSSNHPGPDIPRTQLDAVGRSWVRWS